MAAWRVAGRDRQPGESQSASGMEFRFAGTADTHHRFNPVNSGRIAGPVAAQRTHEQGLAASGADGTLARMLPAHVNPVSAGWGPQSRAGVRGKRLVNR